MKSNFNGNLANAKFELRHFFSPVNLEKVPVNNFANVSVYKIHLPVKFRKHFARAPDKVPVNSEKFPVNLKSAANIKKNAIELGKCARKPANRKRPQKHR